MVTNFEELTAELTDDEKHLVGHLIFMLELNQQVYKSHELESSLKTTGVRIRKVINFIRKNHIAPVIGTSKGYYLSYDREQIEKQIKSLYERASSIRDCAKGMEYFLQVPAGTQFQLSL